MRGYSWLESNQYSMLGFLCIDHDDDEFPQSDCLVVSSKVIVEE